MVLVMKQPDLGTSLTYMPMFACGYFPGRAAVASTSPSLRLVLALVLADWLATCCTIISGPG